MGNKKKKKQPNIDDVLANLKTTITNLNKNEKELKKQALLVKWLKQWRDYIDFEERFEPLKNMKYDAGQIVLINFGYNVGSEQGGIRPAVVIEDNPNSLKTVTVIPLSSLKEDKTREDVESVGNVFLGVIKGYHDVFPNEDGTVKESIAVMSQIRSVSKMRIRTPVRRTPPGEEPKFNTRGSNLKLEPELLKKIYDAIAARYTKYGLETKQADEKKTENQSTKKIK